MNNRDYFPGENINRDYGEKRTYARTGDYGPSPVREYASRQSAQEQHPKKKKGGWLKITAICLAALVICGAAGVGGVASWNGIMRMVRPAIETETTQPEITPEESGADTADSSVPALKTFAKDSEAMTPSEIYKQYVDSVVSIRTETTALNIFGQVTTAASAGTGFVISEDGYILTNNHVVSDGTTITVTLNDGSEYEASVMGADNDSDIAVLKIDAAGLTPVNLGDSDDIVVGEDVAVIGNPLGELTNSLTTGAVSALDRMISTDRYDAINMFQIDAAVNSGNSGGPVFDSTGRVIGVVTAKYSNSTVEGLGFAIPINDAMKVAEELVTNGYVSTGEPTLNIIVRTMDKTTAAYYDVPQGAYVTEVAAGGCCDKAGVQAGDIITKLGSSMILSKEDLGEAKANYAPGDKVEILVYRDGETLKFTVTLDETGAPLN